MATPNTAEKQPAAATDDKAAGSPPADNAAGDAAKSEGGDGENQEIKIYKPEGLPDHMLGKSDQETLDKVLKAYQGARSELAGKKGVPEKFDDYKIDLPEELSKQVILPGDDGKDPVFESMRSVFHEEGISPEAAARIAAKFYGHVAELKGGAEDLSTAADFEFKEFGGTEKAKPYVDGATAFLTGLKSTKKISDEAFQELTAMTTYSEGLKVLNELRPLLGDKVIPAKLNDKGTAGDGEITKAKLDERVADPRYRRGSKEFDQDFYDKTTEMFQEYYAE